MTLAALTLAAAARAQSYGHDVPWSEDPNNSEAATLPRGNVRLAVPLRIRTSHPACFVAAGFPVIRALIDPADNIYRARVLFRPHGLPLWYAVAMRRT